MQGAFSEMDDDIGWNDFALRNYDPQIGRWVEVDPYADDYIGSPYVGMGNDPVNVIDPSGGSIFSGLSVAGRVAAGAILGAVAGGILDAATGGNSNGRDEGIGALLGALTGGTNILFTTKVLIQTANAGAAVINTAVQTQGAGNAGHGPNETQAITSFNTDVTSSVMWANYRQNKLPAFSTLLSNYPLPYNIRPDRTPQNRKLPLDDATGANFLYFNQCAIRVSLSLRRSGVDISGAKNITNPQAGSRGAFPSRCRILFIQKQLPTRVIHQVIRICF